MLRDASLLVQRFVFGRETVVARVPEFDLELRVPTRDPVGRHLFCDGVYAPEITDFFATGLELQPGDVLFDVGASVGWYALLLSRIAPRGAVVYAFEPDPWMRGLLYENVSRNRADATVKIVAAAAGEHSGPALLHRYGSRRRERSQLLRWVRSDTVDVEMLSLDDYCRAEGLEDRPVGLLKIGVQGFEFRALRGARATLGRCRAVLTEFAPRQIEELDEHPEALLDLLVELGFTPAVFVEGKLYDVTRGALLADGAARYVYWRRPGTAPAEAPVPPDPAALAI
jgi:FkbM family methyltransferase